MLGKAIKALAIKTFIKQKGARKSNKEKGVWIVAKKVHPHPLNLKSKVWNQGEED